MSKTLKLYVASSFINPYYDQFIKDLEGMKDAEGNQRFLVYNFKGKGIDLHNYKNNEEVFRKVMYSEKIKEAVERDRQFIASCDLFVLLLPAGKSAHMELGYAAGLKKPCYIVLNNTYEHEIKYLMCGPTTNLIQNCENMYSFLHMLNLVS